MMPVDDNQTRNHELNHNPLLNCIPQTSQEVRNELERRLQSKSILVDIYNINYENG